VRHWTMRNWRPGIKRIVAPWAAGLLVWFSPAVVADSHAWAQWDIWCAPFFIWAVYFACKKRWLVTGVLIATGAMFKGQILLATPAVLIWAFFAGWKPTVRLGVGMLIVGGLMACIFWGSLAWLKVSFLFPTDHFHRMTLSASTIPAIMEE